MSLNNDTLYPKNIKERAAMQKQPSKLFYINVTTDENPFVDQIQDQQKLKEIFREFPFVPYSGTKQNPENTLLSVLKTLAELSPTQASVIQSMSWYCYGGKIGIAKSVDTEFDSERVMLDPAASKQWYEILKTIRPECGYTEAAKQLFKARKYSGEHYLMVRFYEVSGVRKANIQVIDNLKIMPLIHEDGYPDRFITFEKFNYETIEKKKYDIVAKYPYTSELRDGTMATIIQYKNGCALRGRPLETGVMIDIYREYKDNIFLTRQSKNNFAGQVLIEQELSGSNEIDELDRIAQQNGFRNYEDQFANNFTNSGDDPASVVHMFRPSGTAATLIHEFSQNTSEKWFNVVGQLTTNRIMNAHSWSTILMNGGDISKGLSTNLFIDELKIKLPLIEAHQDVECDTLNKAIDTALAWMGIDFTEFDIRFNNPYKTLLDINKESNNPQTNNTPQPNAIP